MIGISIIISVLLVTALAIAYRLWYKERLNPGKVMVIVCAKNEDPDRLRQCLESIEANRVPYVLVDDGSDTKIEGATIWNKKNLGKKFSQLEAVKYMEDVLRYDQFTFIVAVDSDTILAPDAIFTATKQFDEKTGAVVGSIGVLNDRMIDALYWQSFNIGRAIASLFGQVAVCSGAFTVYRAPLFRDIIRESCKRKVNLGEDRYLTYLLLKAGWRTKYAHTALSGTYTPKGKQFIRQQLRWQKSYWKGLVYSFDAYSFKNWYFTFTNFWHGLGRITNILVLGLFLVTLVTGNWSWSLGILGVVVFHSFLSAFFGLVVRKKHSVNMLYFPLWGLYSLFIISPLNIYALLTIKKDDWGTRKSI